MLGMAPRLTCVQDKYYENNNLGYLHNLVVLGNLLAELYRMVVTNKMTCLGLK